jgi:hypothetical protein
VPRHITTAPFDLSRARYEIELYLLGGMFDLYENDRRIATVEPDRSAVEVSYGKLIFSCWGDGWSRSWRALSCELMPARLRLECSRQMGRALCAVELRRGPVIEEAAQSRSEFPSKLAALIETNFAGLRVERAVASRNDHLHLSGIHARLTIDDHGRLVAGIGASRIENQSTINATLGAGILWLDALRLHAPSVARLMIFVPRDCAAAIAARLTALEVKGASFSLYEIDEPAALIKPVAPFDQGDLSDHFRKASRQAEWPGEFEPPPSVAAVIDGIRALAPDVIELRRRGGWILLSIQGLDFARVSTSGKRIEFGIGQSKTRLAKTNQTQLEELVADIIKIRTSESRDRASPLFREQEERWLEATLLRRAQDLHALLDPRYVYSQTPAYRGEERSFIDMLAVTREGRLVVIELKISEDAEFAFQGLDYWLKIEWHRSRGDFQRRGYFKGKKLSDEPPLIYLVAPLFRFHATTARLASCIAGRAAVYRLGINEDWRAGPRVLLFERVN